MKTLIISHFLPFPPHGGAPQRNYNLLREASRRHDIDLLTFNQRLFLKRESDLQTAIDAMRQFCKEVSVFRIPSDYSRLRWYLLLFFNLFSLTPYSVWRFHSRSMARAINEHLHARQYDLVQIDTIALAPYARHARAIPCVLVHQNVESSLMLRRSSNEKNPLTRLYLYFQAKKLRRYEARVIGQFSCNICVSDLDKGELERLNPAAGVSVIPNGTDTSYFRPEDTSSSHGLVFTGGMTWYPNRDAMIYFCNEIYPRIKSQMPDTDMTIIGRVPPQPVLDAAAADSSIKALGYVEDTRPFLARSAVYVVPIRVGGGSRLKILDALACGKAIVSTTVGAEGLKVTPEENILIGDSPDEFARQVVRLLTDSDLRRKLQVNGRKLVEEQYAWSIIGQQQEYIYQRLLR